MLLEQGTTLTLGHAAPHAELDTIVEGVRATLQDDRTVTADDCGLALRGAADEQLVRVGLPAAGLRNPGDPRFGLGTVNRGRGEGGCGGRAHRGPNT
jgi:hypothetical protein